MITTEDYDKYLTKACLLLRSQYNYREIREILGISDDSHWNAIGKLAGNERQLRREVDHASRRISEERHIDDHEEER